VKFRHQLAILAAAIAPLAALAVVGGGAASAATGAENLATGLNDPVQGYRFKANFATLDSSRFSPGLA
jgi:hypothetical protein